MVKVVLNQTCGDISHLNHQRKKGRRKPNSTFNSKISGKKIGQNFCSVGFLYRMLQTYLTI